ncbi:hypothetical protein OAS86_00585 [Gammaproteobacteria bacterium]|nr:hypothetical protein [Gammaproteobacteria bacterium]
MLKFGRFRRLLAVIAAMASVTAQANFSCDGQVARLSVTNGGALLINNGYGNHYACAVTGTQPSQSLVVDSEVCRMWYATALAADVKGKAVKIWYQSNSSSSSSCNSTANWGWNSIYHIDFDF